MKKIQRIISQLKQRLQSGYRFVLTQLSVRPVVSVISFFALLLLLVIVGNFLRKPEETKAAAEAPAARVNIFSQNEQPMMEFTAKVEKTGVITIMAQSPGIVRKINITEGKNVAQGASIVSLSSTYQGSSAPSLQRQIAERNNAFSKESYDIQKDLIAKQRNLANQGNAAAEEMREMTRQSLDDTQGLIRLNEEIYNSIDTQIKTLESNPPSAANDQLILSAKQGKAAVAAGLNQLRTGLRTAEYQSSEDKTPAQTADASRELTLRQLDLQEKSLDLNRDLSDLTLKLARVSEQTMFPASPCAGVVERVYVQVGEMVNPGTPIATIRAHQTQADAVVALPAEIARQVNQLEPSIFVLNGKEISVYPRFISTEATEGSLFSISYTLPKELTEEVTQGTNVTVRVPVGGKKTATKNIIAPIDAVYQTADKAYVYVVKTATQSAEAGQSGQAAELREVVLGNITGEYVTVNSGLQPTDQVITTRGITNGQRVTTK